jgi:nitrate reductase gamma subunit
MTLSDLLIFVVLPYMAVGQLLPAILFRRLMLGPTAEPDGSPLLHADRATWFTRAAWIGAAMLVLLHVVPFLAAGPFAGLISHPVRLLAVEMFGAIGGVVFAVGVAGILWRRLCSKGLAGLRTALEVAALLALVVAAVGGVLTAANVRWGAAWYTHVIGPYLWSLVRLDPSVEALSALGFWPRLHLGAAFVAMGLVPFTTLPRQLLAPVSALFGARPATATGANQ